MKIHGVPIAALLLTCCVLARAQDVRAPVSAPPESIHYGWADVLRVDPVYDDAGPPPSGPPREECYEEQVQVAPDNRAGSTVLGAIVGGVIGHSFGKGSGRVATTAAGVAAGAAIGNNVAAAEDDPRGYRTERHCRIVDSPGGKRHILAYDIEYRYRGELYTSRMNFDPGDRLRVRVSVTPAE
jgi:uncharacterized protein YcfJ